MLNVHGIAVSGPTFPAQIWHLYMDTAIGNRPDVPFPPAQTQPQWTSWRGQYQYSGSYGTTARDHDDGDDDDGGARRRQLAPTTTADPSTTAPATTAAPPPPPTTTETQPPPPPTAVTGARP